MMLITAFGSPEVMHQAHQLGVTYLPKPFKLREFIDAVRGILGGAVHPTEERAEA
jgi:DNA-binding response OmpR family regulator